MPNVAMSEEHSLVMVYKFAEICPAQFANIFDLSRESACASLDGKYILPPSPYWDYTAGFVQ